MLPHWLLHIVEIIQFVTVFTVLGIIAVRILNSWFMDSLSDPSRVDSEPYINVAMEFVLIVVVMIVVFFIIKRISEYTPSIASFFDSEFSPTIHTMESVVHISLGYVLFESSRSLGNHIDRLLS